LAAGFFVGERRSTMEKKTSKKPFRQTSKKDQSADLSSTHKLAEKLGFRKVKPPKAIRVVFPKA